MTEGVSTPQLPPIRIRFEVREPPERSWSRLRTCLIDNPRDDGLTRRQEIWTYQKRNRGVIKSLEKTLPHIPFRVRRKNVLKKHLSDHDLNKVTGANSKSFLPKISKREGSPEKDSRDKNGRSRPLGKLHNSDEIVPSVKCNNQLKEINSKYETIDTVKDEPKEKDPVLVKRRKKCSRLPDLPVIRTKDGKALKQSKRVSFSMDDILNESPLNRPQSRGSSASSKSSTVSDNEIGNYGPSSHAKTEPIPKSVLDIINGNHLSDPRIMSVSRKKHSNSVSPSRAASKGSTMATSTTAEFPGMDSDRIWFERVLGDREIIDMNNYESYARAPRMRPASEVITRPPLMAANSPDRRLRPPNPTSLPRFQSEPLPDRRNIKPQPQPAVNSKLPPSPKLPVSPKVPVSPKMPGEPIAPVFSSVPQSPSYFPLFSRNGLPMRRIGGPPRVKARNLKITFPNSAPDLQES